MTIQLDTDKMLAEVRDGIGWMTFNNPARHNAMSAEMNRAIPTIIGAFADDPSVRVVVMRGAGGRAFVSGADISEFGERRTSVDARKEYDAIAAEAQRALTKLDKPLIAMIEGYCMGGGVLTAMKADIRIASDNSQFAVPAAKLGLGYGYGGVEALVDLVGKAVAAEVLFTARRYSASEAAGIGLINRSVPAAELETTVVDLASVIAGNAPMTIRAIKAAIGEVGKDPDRRDLVRVAELTEACFRSEDYREGQAAFLEKRTPNFADR
ncbi:MAG: enoyl-CoA hydratase [Acidimicrobiales bacterium]